LVKTGVEYADENITVYPSCPFACKYCWASMPLFQYRIRNPKPIQEAYRLSRARKKRVIVVSFTSDPYQPKELVEQKTRRVLEILSSTIHRIMILTKNPMLAIDRDHDILVRGDIWLGTTLTSTRFIPDEPHAPVPRERMEGLKLAHKLGVKTWVSIEPWLRGVTNPLEIIDETYWYVDYYVLGRHNYETRFGYPKVPDSYYAERLPKVIDRLKQLNKKFFIKKELRRVLKSSY